MVISNPLHYKGLTADFFEKRKGTYAKVLVKLDKANINDTISFKYADRRYEAFIREMVPVGLDWFAVAFVVESSPPEKPISVPGMGLRTVLLVSLGLLRGHVGFCSCQVSV